MLNMLTRCTSVSRDNLSDTRDGRRESEAVIHGIFVFKISISSCCVVV